MLCSLKQIIICSLGIIALSGCQHQEVVANIPKIPYIIFCETEELPTGDLISSAYQFEIDNEQIQEITSFYYTADYPLCNYNQTSKKFLYVANHDLHNKIMQTENFSEETLLTDGAASVNSMFSSGEKVFLLAEPIGKYCMKPAFLNFNSGNVDYINNFDESDDLFAWAAAYDTTNDKIYITAYSDSQLHDQLGENGYSTKPPDTTLYKVDIANESISTICSFTGENIMSIAADAGKLFIVSSPYYNYPPINYSFLDVETGVREAVSLPINCTINSVLYDDVLYYIGREEEKRGLYAYKFSTGQKKLIYAQKDSSFINNVFLNT